MIQAVRKFWRRDDGNATVEFVIMFPAILLIFMSLFEVAMITTRTAMLERGLDMAMRAVRLTTGTSPTGEQIRQKICSHAGVLPDCVENMIIEMTPVHPPAFNMPDYRAPCVNRSSEEELLDSLTFGVGNQLIVVRACYVVDPIFPLSGAGMGLTRAEDGGFQLMSASAFVAEP